MEIWPDSIMDQLPAHILKQIEEEEAARQARHTHTHSHTHALTHTHSHTHALTHTHTHTHSHTLTHALDGWTTLFIIYPLDLPTTHTLD